MNYVFKISIYVEIMNTNYLHIQIYKIEKINLTYKRLKKRLYIIPEQTQYNVT